MGCTSMDWIDLAQDRGRRRTLVNKVMKFGFHKMRGISWVAGNRLASQERLLHEICTSHQPISGAGFARRLNQVRRFISCVYKTCVLYIYISGGRGGALSPTAPPHPHRCAPFLSWNMPCRLHWQPHIPKKLWSLSQLISAITVSN
jgi:hypothetical protein